MIIINSIIILIALLNLPSTITQFDVAEEYGTIGLLAENYAPFFELKAGMYVVVMGEENELYKIVEVLEYQALQPDSVYSDFYADGILLTYAEMFMKVYGVSDRVVFQTCIEKDGILNWGRLFVIAEKVQ